MHLLSQTNPLCYPQIGRQWHRLSVYLRAAHNDGFFRACAQCQCRLQTCRRFRACRVIIRLLTDDDVPPSGQGFDGQGFSRFPPHNDGFVQGIGFEKCEIFGDATMHRIARPDAQVFRTRRN